MNNQEWLNFKEIIQMGKSICINISIYTNFLSNYTNPISQLLEPCTEREILKQGLYGTFPGNVKVYVNKRVPDKHIQIFLGSDLPKDVNDSGWSAPIPIELITSKDVLNRLLDLKVFW